MQVVEIQAVMLIVYKIQAVVHEANQNNADHKLPNVKGRLVVRWLSEITVHWRTKAPKFTCSFTLTFSTILA